MTTGGTSRSPAAERVLQRRGFRRPEELSTDAFNLLVYPRQVDEHPSVLRLPNGDFAASVGTLITDGKRDRAALPIAYERFRGDVAALDDALGSFGVIVYHDGVLHIAADPIGGFGIYDNGAGCISSSFLAVAALTPRLTMTKQTVYEFVLNGAVTGDETLVREIGRLPLRAAYRLERGSAHPALQIASPELPVLDPRPREVLLTEAGALLDESVRQISEAFDGQVTCGLTSGYDSRLVLALLRRRGVTPRLLVYRAGAVRERTAATAQALADVAGVPLDVIDRDTGAMPPPDELPGIVEANLLACDGWLYHGFFVRPVDVAYRADRSPRDRVYAHGAGGEIHRTVLPDRPISARDFVRAYYLKHDERVCSSLYGQDAYTRAIEDKWLGVAGLSGVRGGIDRETVEWAYGMLRVRSWSAREIGLDNATGAAVTPLMNRRVLHHGACVPSAYKMHGTFTADLIQRADPQLAAVHSPQYGHDFASPPPFKRRAIEGLWDRVPLGVRPVVFGLRTRRAARAPDRPWLSDAFVHAALPDGLVRLAPLFDATQPMEYLTRARMLSVEALAAHLGTGLTTDWGG